MKEITIIIPTLHEEKTIPVLLQSLEAERKLIEEIIVVDGGSDDKTISIAKSFGVRTIMANKANVSYQRNLGAKKAKSKLLLFLDADVIPTNNFIKESMNEFKKRNLQIACPSFLSKSESRLVRISTQLFSHIFHLSARSRPAGAGMAILVDRTVFQNEGGFREVPFEDLELISRLGKTYRYGVLHSKVVVSDRRYQHHGVYKTLITYGLISIVFLLGLKSLYQYIHYPMDKHRFKK